MLPANKLYYLSKANESICVFMMKDACTTTYKFYDPCDPDEMRLRIALFGVGSLVAVCYELSENGMIIAEDTSDLLHPNIIPGLIAAIFFDVFENNT